MTSNMRILYLYIVAFITLGMIVGGIVSAVYNFTSYFYPTDYVFFQNTTEDNNDYYEDDSVDYEEQERTEAQKRNYKKQYIKSGIVSVITGALGGALYKYHWGIIEKERNKKEG